MHVQLSDVEFGRLHTYLQTFPKGERMDSIQEKENKVTLRVIDSWRDSLLVIMERDCDSKSCNGITMKCNSTMKRKIWPITAIIITSVKLILGISII